MLTLLERRAMEITAERARAIIQSQAMTDNEFDDDDDDEEEKVKKGQFFTVTFLKRNTNKRRTLTCRTGVRKHLKGGDAAYNFADHDLVSVWTPDRRDDKDTGYRSIPLESILEISIGGEHYVVVR